MTDRAMPDFETYYTIWQDDDEQAGASDLGQAAHFAMIYGQDGPVELQTDVTFTFQGHLTREEIRAALSAAPSGDGEAVDRIVALLATADVAVEQDSVGRSYRWIRNDRELAQAILAAMGQTTRQSEEGGG